MKRIEGQIHLFLDLIGSKRTDFDPAVSRLLS